MGSSLQCKRITLNPTNKIQDTAAKWKKPSKGLLKMNVDGAWIEDKATVKIIIGDDQGEIMVALTEQIGRTPDDEGAEIMELLIVCYFQWIIILKA
ncbi:hypothetical protein ACH5RR_029420 [Cinchona calisaya]|uniref:Uncharacterized protein n=1 Tax=Cinchona calisaya TaxID=153742 RepID=A0ABD2YT72_9GENT